MAVKKKPKAKKGKRPKKLSPAKARIRRIDKAPLYNPTAVLRGIELKRAADRLTNVEFGPKMAAVSDATRTAKAQGNALIKGTEGYYKSLAAGEADRVARQRALASELDTRLTRINTDTSSQIDRASQDAQEAARESAALRGGVDAGTGQRMAEELAAQRTRAAETAQAYRSSAATESANYGGLVQAAGAARTLHGAETRKELVNRLANRISTLQTERKSLVQQKADARVKNVLNLRQSGFDNIATLEGLQVKNAAIAGANARSAASIAAANARSAASIGAANARAQLSASTQIRGQNLTLKGKKLSIKAQAKKGKKGSKQPQSSLNTRAAIVTVKGEYGSLLRRFGGDHARTAKAIRSRAAKSGKRLPEYILNASADLVNHGYVTPGHVRDLRAAGVRVPKSWTKRPLIAPNPFG